MLFGFHLGSANGEQQQKIRGMEESEIEDLFPWLSCCSTLLQTDWFLHPKAQLQSGGLFPQCTIWVLSFYLSIYPSIYLPIYLPTYHLSIYSFLSPTVQRYPFWFPYTLPTPLKISSLLNFPQITQFEWIMSFLWDPD